MFTLPDTTDNGSLQFRFGFFKGTTGCATFANPAVKNTGKGHQGTQIRASWQITQRPCECRNNGESESAILTNLTSFGCVKNQARLIDQFKVIWDGRTGNTFNDNGANG